jgi:hypothetical protein
MTTQTALTGLPVSQEISELFDEAEGARICRDKCVASVFKAKRAIWFARRDVECRRQAWALVYELWPETRRGEWYYDNRDRKLHRQDSEE